MYSEKKKKKKKDNDDDPLTPHEMSTLHFRPYFLAPAVLPGDPFHAVSRVAQAITTGKFLAVPVGVATLSAHQGQEVELVKVHLQENGESVSLA